MADSSTAIVPASSTSVALPVPQFTGQQMVDALVAYREVQRALDGAMPEAIIDVEGRPFRKKAYWRAIAVAFNLDVDVVEERREVSGSFHDGRENVGYVVTCRATTRSGRSVTGDGSCFAVEKAARFRCPHPHPSWDGKSLHYPHESCPDFDADYRWREYPAQASEHNLRSHAHTRAFNRAVSNNVGFGEVSAEEVERDDRDERHAPTTSRRTSSASSNRPPRVISDLQRKRLWAIAKEAGWKEPEVKAYLLRVHHVEHTDAITVDKYDAICKALELGVEPAPAASEVSS